VIISLLSIHQSSLKSNSSHCYMAINRSCDSGNSSAKPVTCYSATHWNTNSNSNRLYFRYQVTGCNSDIQVTVITSLLSTYHSSPVIMICDPLSLCFLSVNYISTWCWKNSNKQPKLRWYLFINPISCSQEDPGLHTFTV
jgi:hypothetical protein